MSHRPILTLPSKARTTFTDKALHYFKEARLSCDNETRGALYAIGRVYVTHAKRRAFAEREREVQRMVDLSGYVEPRHAK